MFLVGGSVQMDQVNTSESVFSFSSLSYQEKISCSLF